MPTRRLCPICGGAHWRYVQLFSRDVFRCRDCDWQVALTPQETAEWRSAILASDADGLRRLREMFHFLDGESRPDA